MQELTAWFRRYRTIWLLGPATWGLLAAAGWVHARLAGLPVLQVVVTWQEWFAALLLLPYLATVGAKITRTVRSGQPDRPPLVSMGYLLALIVFGLDLVVRAVFGLGWEPFLLG